MHDAKMGGAMTPPQRVLRPYSIDRHSGLASPTAFAKILMRSSVTKRCEMAMSYGPIGSGGAGLVSPIFWLTSASHWLMAAFQAREFWSVKVHSFRGDRAHFDPRDRISSPQAFGGIGDSLTIFQRHHEQRTSVRPAEGARHRVTPDRVDEARDLIPR